MTYCLKCRKEFQDWVALCPDCSLSLVDSLPELSKSEIKPESWEEPTKELLIHIATTSTEQLAKVWAGILKVEGIDSFIKSGDWYMSVAIPYYPPSYEIHVLDSTAELAKKLLKPAIDDGESIT